MNPELYNAAIHGSPDFSDKLKGILDSTTDHEQLITSGQKNTILHIAAKTGKLHIEEDDDRVLRFLYDQNKKGDTPLHIAAKLGNLEMTRILVAMAKKADVEQNRKLLSMVNHEKDTALHEAVRHNRFEVVKLLIEEDQGLASTENSDGESPLFIAVYRRFFQVAFHILDSAPNCSFGGRRGMNVLHAAVIRSHSWKVYNLRGILRNVSRRLGLGRLYSFRKPEKTRTGSRVVQRSRVLYFAENIKLYYEAGYLSKSFPELSNEDRDIVHELLMTRFEDRLLMEKADDFGWIPLHYAACIGHKELVDLLLANSSRPLALTRTKKGSSALHISATKGYVDVINLLIEKCPEICESLNEKDQTALHVAVEQKRKNAVKCFLESLAFQDLVNEKDKNGNTALHLAASMVSEGDIEILTILAHDSNIDKGAVNKAGMTFLDVLLSNKQLKRSELSEIMSNWEREIYLPSFVTETREANQSTCGETKTDETQVEEKGGKVEDNNPTTEDIKMQKQLYWQKVKQALKDSTNINLVIVTIIASVTFAALFTMPGGYNDKGLLILKGRRDFKLFLLYDTASFVLSTTSLAIHFIAPALGNSAVDPFHPILGTSVLTLFSLVTWIFAFEQGMSAVLSGDQQIVGRHQVSSGFFVLISLFIGAAFLFRNA